MSPNKEACLVAAGVLENHSHACRTYAQARQLEAVATYLRALHKSACPACGGVKRIQREPCSCGSVMVRSSDLVTIWICDPCDSDVYDEDTIPCPKCTGQ